MKASQDNRFRYEVVRSRRSTADIVIERDGSVLVRAPEWADDDQVANIVESKHYWIYQSLAEWRDLNATRVLREYKNGEGFLYLGPRLPAARSSATRTSRCSSRTVASRCVATWSSRARSQRPRPPSGTTTSPRAWSALRERVDYYAPKVGVEPTRRRRAASSATAGPRAHPPASSPSTGSA